MGDIMGNVSDIRIYLFGCCLIVVLSTVMNSSMVALTLKMPAKFYRPPYLSSLRS